MARIKNILLLLAILFYSCTSDPFESGDGKYSYYTSEMTTFIPDKDGVIYIGELDDSRAIELTKTVKPGWAKENVPCRMMLYFNKQNETPYKIFATPLGGEEVYMPGIALADTMKTPPVFDPIKVVSTWTSKNGKYFNMHFAVKSGKADQKQLHSIGLICDSVNARTQTLYLSFIHNQNDIPQFYTEEAFMSISKTQLQKFSQLSDPKLHINIYTYDGVKSFTGFAHD